MVNKNKYPFIMVHGMMGWGEEEGLYSKFPYWGMVTGNMVEELRKSGHEAYAPKVSPVGSAWARACELYAQLMGTRVDYGVAHAQKYNHARYGRTYDKPLVPGWGEKMADGSIKKIHLIGHSFGGATTRLLVSLLTEGSAEEREATPEGELSPLFAGGHGDWVQSLTSLAAPHDGTTCIHAFPTLLKGIKAVTMVSGALLSNFGLGGFYDIHMEQYGINTVPGESNGGSKLLSAEQKNGIRRMLENTDNVYDDLSIPQAMEMNRKMVVSPDTYYFSVATKGTMEDPFNYEYQIKAPIAAGLFLPTCFAMGRFPEGEIGGTFVSRYWRSNDGLVPTESALYPHLEPHKLFKDEDGKYKKGIWYVMEPFHGDHGTVIGGSAYFILMPWRKRQYKRRVGDFLDFLATLED